MAERLGRFELGGGVVGVTTAYFLARAGHEVTILALQDAMASGRLTARAINEKEIPCLPSTCERHIFGK